MSTRLAVLDDAIRLAQKKQRAAFASGFRAMNAQQLAAAHRAETDAACELRQSRLRALFERIECIRRGFERIAHDARQIELFGVRS